MKSAKIIRDFNFATDEGLEIQVGIIYSGMDGNGNFPDPTPTVPALNSAIVAYRAALGAASKGGEEAGAIKNEIKANLVATLNTLANYVTMIADGNRAILISSGFTITPINDNPTVLGPVVNFCVKHGKVSGSVVLSCDGIEHRTNYIFQYALTSMPEGESWTQVISNKRTVTIDGLDPLKQYSFKLTVGGPRGQFSYSTTIFIWVV